MTRRDVVIPCVALLRGVNVGGHGHVAMAELRRVVADIGLSEVRSLLQSGNLVFRGEAQPTEELERMLDTAVRERLDLVTSFFVRTLEQWLEVVSGNPFSEAAERDPSHLVVMLLKQAPAAESVAALQAAISGPELVRVQGTHAYLVYPDGIGHSRLTGAVIERKLGTSGTARNWNTVLKLATLAAS
jgi:uncharacterized protein (DUF1697 family)